MVWRGRFSIRDGRSAASSIQGYEPAGPILDYALKPQIMAPGYLPEAFAINDSCKADGRKRRGPEQLSFIHQGEIARALSYLLAALSFVSVSSIRFSREASDLRFAIGLLLLSVLIVIFFQDVIVEIIIEVVVVRVIIFRGIL